MAPLMQTSASMSRAGLKIPAIENLGATKVGGGKAEGKVEARTPSIRD